MSFIDAYLRDYLPNPNPRFAITWIKCQLNPFLTPKQALISSPEHDVLRVSYCDHSSSVVVCDYLPKPPPPTPLLP